MTGDDAADGRTPAPSAPAARRAARRAVRARAAIGATAALALAVGVTAGRASAATLSADKACYVNAASAAPMTITGAGFGPGDPIRLNGGTVNATTTAGTTGAFAITTKAPTIGRLGPATKRTTLTVTDINPADGNETKHTITVTSANLAVASAPRQVSNLRKDRVTFTFSGFTPGKPIYGFFVHRKVVASARFGTASGPCGTLTSKALLYPGGRPADNRYNVTFESSPTYSATFAPHVTGVLTILQL
ncbi:MAG: hypothetical protein ABSH51_04180 [Solirubrobacteraceae bacterium]